MQTNKNILFERHSLPVMVFFLVIIICLSLPACKDKGAKVSNQTPAQVSLPNPCTLVTQQEIDSLFSGSAGAGRSSTQAPNVQTCTWPQEGVPKFILEVMKAPSGSVRQSIDAGQGYQVRDITGLGGEAAVAIQQANPKYGLKEGVAILGLRKGSVMITLSPVHLDIKEGTQKFLELKALADKVAERL